MHADDNDRIREEGFSMLQFTGLSITRIPGAVNAGGTLAQERAYSH
jgi:hypothetical protein